MNKAPLKHQWLEEERVAYIHGWNFSHIHGRCEEENDLPWNYEELVRKYLKPEHDLLDLDTGGGEFLLSLNHPFCSTSATEGYSPNVSLCQEILTPLGIKFHEADAGGTLPFTTNSFDVVINRHGDFNVEELYRVLNPNGIFITEQVGAENDRELVRLLLHDIDIPFPELYLHKVSQKFTETGFTILHSQEAFRPIRFYDVGALVWFAHIIEWEFPGFAVDKCLNELYVAQDMLEKRGYIEGMIHRFLLVAKKT